MTTMQLFGRGPVGSYFDMGWDTDNGSKSIRYWRRGDGHWWADSRKDEDPRHCNHLTRVAPHERDEDLEDSSFCFRCVKWMPGYRPDTSNREVKHPIVCDGERRLRDRWVP